MNSSIAGPTWFGNQPVPMSSLSLQTMKNSPTMMLPTPGQPKGPTSSSRSMKVGIGGMMPRRSMMPGGGLGVNNSVAMAPLPAPIMGGGGGGHHGGGGGGGQSFSFAPTNYSNGDRYNAQGYRPDGRRQILGGQSRNSSGLDDYYAMNALPDASPEERNAAVDAMNASGQTAGFGGYGTAPEGTMPRRFAKGGYLPAGEPGIVADAGTELAVPHDGTRPELLPAVPGAPGGYEFTPSKDVTILPAPVVKRLPQLTADGITPLGNGDAVMSNRYGSGFVTHSPDGTKHFIDPQTGDQLMPTPGKRLRFAPVPDVVPEGHPLRTMTGTMPGDARIPREQIALFNKDRAAEIAAVQGIDPATVAAEMYLNDPNSYLKERLAMPRPRRAIVPTEARLPELGAALATAGNTGAGPGGLFTPMQMRRAAQAMQSRGNTRAGRRMLGEWMANQEDATMRTMDVPGTDYIVPVVGNRPLGTLPKHSSDTGFDSAQVQVQKVDHGDGTHHFIYRNGPMAGKPVPANNMLTADGRQVHRTQDKPATVRYFDNATGKIVEFDPQDEVSSIMQETMDDTGKKTSTPRFTPLRKTEGSNGTAAPPANAPASAASSLHALMKHRPTAKP